MATPRPRYLGMQVLDPKKYPELFERTIPTPAVAANAAGEVVVASGPKGGLVVASVFWIPIAAIARHASNYATLRLYNRSRSNDIIAQVTTQGVAANQGVASIAVSEGGTGYTSAPTVVFTGGGGTGAAATAVLAADAVDTITVTAAGSGYTSAPTISFTGGAGADAAATATLGYAAIAAYSQLAMALEAARLSVRDGDVLTFAVSQTAAGVAVPVGSLRIVTG